MRLLVACDRLALTGGLLRFERAGAVLRRWGHDVAFARLGTSPGDDFTSALRVLDVEAAAREHWDAVMVPGGGFPDATIEGFARLRDPCFGLRVQHFLNGPARAHAYGRVTASFDPDLILVNNHHWSQDALSAFRRPTQCLVGAVDAALFAPAPARPPRPGRRRLGAIANKNPAALLDALDRLGEGWELHWFGTADPQRIAARGDLVSAGRLVSRGPLFGADLAAFYREIDVFCSAETYAGWCNPAAEAMASGTPLVATIHGTLAFAEHGVTAHVLADSDGEAVARAVADAVTDIDRTQRLAAAGRRRIRTLSWEVYAAGLLGALDAQIDAGARLPAASRRGWSPAPAEGNAAPPEASRRIAAIARDAGPPPRDFDAMGYLRLYPDLKALFDEPWQGILHYLEYGRREGRIYPSTVTRAQEKATQARRIALVVDGLDGSGKSSVACGVAAAIGATVLAPFKGKIGGLMVHLAEAGQHDLADAVAHGAVAMAITQAPPGPVVFDRHWFTASQLLSHPYREGWEPRPFTVMAWADRPTSVARMVARGDANPEAAMTEDRVAIYRRFAADLDLPLVDTSFLTPEQATAQVLDMMPSGVRPGSS